VCVWHRTTDQTAEFMLEKISAGDFYVICPDNEVDREVDNARMTWTMQDITENRSPLSRWYLSTCPIYPLICPIYLLICSRM
jgi:hypothetical protein